MTHNKEKNIIFFDIETTGLDLKKDKIIQIGMIKTTSNLEIIEKIEQKLNPEDVVIKDDAFEKHHISLEELKEQPKFEQIADFILSFTEDCDIAGHNCLKFDIPFLMEEMKRCGKLFTIEKRRIIDTRLMYNTLNVKTLEDIYKEYIPTPIGCESHDAICDSQMCYEVYKEMVNKHNLDRVMIDVINGNYTRIDIDGFFVLNDNNKVCMGKGKFKGKPIEDVDVTYLEWLYKQDIALETKNFVHRCYNYLQKINQSRN